MTQSTDMQVYTCRLPSSWIQALRERADHTHNPASVFLREALIEWAERRDIDLEEAA